MMLESRHQTLGASNAFSELIGSIYDCTLNPDLWDETLGAIRDAIECRTAVLSLADLVSDRILLTRSVGIEPYWLERVFEHTSEINARLGEALAEWPSLDEPFIVSRHLPETYFATSPYYNEVLKPQGMVDIMNFWLMASPARYSAFAVARHESTGVVGDRQIALSKLLMPHIRRAVTISNVLDPQSLERSRMADALDALRCGVVLANENGSILHANRSAERMLQQGRPLRAKGGVLGTNDEAATNELRAAIKLAARDETVLGRTGLAVALAEPDERTVFAHVLPLTTGDKRTQLQRDAVAAVFVGQPDERDGAALVAAGFGLTPAEARFLRGLVAGSTVAETATSLGIAHSTARTHLENIFSKTGLGRQADLVLLAARLAPPVQSAPPPS
jgi:DNA-binding CsgD family transcriptional regulator/PAS domain-containing protein